MSIVILFLSTEEATIYIVCSLEVAEKMIKLYGKNTLFIHEFPTFCFPVSATNYRETLQTIFGAIGFKLYFLPVTSC